LKIPYDVRNQHIYIPGKTRQGKTTLMHEMALQDIENGAGVCVIEPKGDLSTSLLHHIPESRKDDCIFIHPDRPIPVEFFDYVNPREKQTIVGEIKHIVTKGVSSENAPQMNRILNYVIYTILDCRDHDGDATFIDIHDFLEYDDRRAKILDFVKDPRLQKRWTKENMPNLKDRQPVVNRMSDFTSSAYLQTVLGYARPQLNLDWVMNNRKILLVNLGGIDEPTSLFATLLIAKIHQLMKRRWKLVETGHEPIPFHLYVDEFSFFQISEVREMLCFDGGYGLRLVIANQYKLTEDLREAIFNNVDSFIIFKVGSSEARNYSHLTQGYYRDANDRPFPIDLANIRKHCAFYCISGQPPIYQPTNPPRPRPESSYARYIKDRTLRNYGPEACKSVRVPDNSENGSNTETNPPRAPQDNQPPQKEAGRPALPPAGTQQSHHPNHRK